MLLPFAYLDASVIEEVPVDLWRRVFDQLGWPVSLDVRRETFTHVDVRETIARGELTDDSLQLLEVLHTLGTEVGAEAIQNALDDQRVARESLPFAVSERELAVYLFLAQRHDASLADVFARAQVHVQEQGEHRRYHEFLGHAPRGVRQLAAKADALAAATRAQCQAQDLGDHVQIHAFEDDGTYVFQILRSHRTRKPLAVVEGHSARATIAYRPVHGDLLRYEAAVGRLRIAARAGSFVEFYRRTLGRVLFSDEDFFTGDPVCSLRVLQNEGRAALDQHQMAEVGRVWMTECVWERGDRALVHLRSPDCFRQVEGLQLPFHEGMLLQATLKLQVIGTSTRPVTVTIRAPSRIEVSQSQHEALVNRYLTTVGIRGGGGQDAAPTLWALAPWRHPIDVWRSVFVQNCDSMIERGVLRPIRLERVPSPAAPTGGSTLHAVALDAGAFYGVANVPDVGSRTLTATDLDGFELQPEALRQVLRSELGATGVALPWENDEALLELGVVTVGEQCLYLAYALRRPVANLRERLGARAAGAPIVVLCPSAQLPVVDVPLAPLEHPVPTRREAVRAAIIAAGLQQAVPAVCIAPDGAHLVVDRGLGMVWIDEQHIPGLKPGTHPLRFVTMLAEAKGRPVESQAIKAELSGARSDGDTVVRQAKMSANRAIHEAMAAAGRAIPNDLFPKFGTGAYRCTLSSFVV